MTRDEEDAAGTVSRKERYAVLQLGNITRAHQEVNMLPYEIAADAALTGLDELAYCLKGTAAPLHELRYHVCLVVVEGPDIVLEGLLKLIHDEVGLQVLDGDLEVEVGFDNVDQLVDEVVFGGFGANPHDHRGIYMQGG